MLKSRLEEELKKELKKKEELRVSVLRLLIFEIHNKEIEKRGDLEEAEEVAILSKEIKKRKEAIFEFERGKRSDLAQKERKEIEIIQKYLPKQLSEGEIIQKIDEVINKTKAKDIKDMGKVMGMLMKDLKGKADPQRVAEIVKKRLLENET